MNQPPLRVASILAALRGMPSPSGPPPWAGCPARRPIVRHLPWYNYGMRCKYLRPLPLNRNGFAPEPANATRCSQVLAGVDVAKAFSMVAPPNSAGETGDLLVSHFSIASFEDEELTSIANVTQAGNDPDPVGHVIKQLTEAPVHIIATSDINLPKDLSAHDAKTIADVVTVEDPVGNDQAYTAVDEANPVEDAPIVELVVVENVKHIEEPATTEDISAVEDLAVQDINTSDALAVNKGKGKAVEDNLFEDAEDVEAIVEVKTVEPTVEVKTVEPNQCECAICMRVAIAVPTEVAVEDPAPIQDLVLVEEIAAAEEVVAAEVVAIQEVVTVEVVAIEKTVSVDGIAAVEEVVVTEVVAAIEEIVPTEVVATCEDIQVNKDINVIQDVKVNQEDDVFRDSNTVQVAEGVNAHVNSEDIKPVVVKDLRELNRHLTPIVIDVFLHRLPDLVSSARSEREIREVREKLSKEIKPFELPSEPPRPDDPKAVEEHRIRTRMAQLAKANKERYENSTKSKSTGSAPELPFHLLEPVPTVAQTPPAVAVNGHVNSQDIRPVEVKNLKEWKRPVSELVIDVFCPRLPDLASSTRSTQEINDVHRNLTKNIDICVRPIGPPIPGNLMAAEVHCIRTRSADLAQINMERNVSPTRYNSRSDLRACDVDIVPFCLPASESCEAIVPLRLPAITATSSRLDPF